MLSKIPLFVTADPFITKAELTYGPSHQSFHPKCHSFNKLLRSLDGSLEQWSELDKNKTQLLICIFLHHKSVRQVVETKLRLNISTFLPDTAHRRKLQILLTAL